MNKMNSSFTLLGRFSGGLWSIVNSESLVGSCSQFGVLMKISVYVSLSIYQPIHHPSLSVHLPIIHIYLFIYLHTYLPIYLLIHISESPVWLFKHRLTQISLQNILTLQVCVVIQVIWIYNQVSGYTTKILH